jgi:hypothetical protein
MPTQDPMGLTKDTIMGDLFFASLSTSSDV